MERTRKARGLLIWIGLVLVLGVPLAFAATSEYLEWRDPIYIAAGFAGVVALCLAFLQPLLARGWLPGLHTLRGRRLHAWIGILLLVAVIVHVAGLWLTSPPDIIDALLLRSPTPFALWGVVAMWSLFAAALISTFRRRLAPKVWRAGHETLVAITVLGGAAHAMLIEGTMEPTSKAILCGLTILATIAAIAFPWWKRGRRSAKGR